MFEPSFQWALAAAPYAFIGLGVIANMLLFASVKRDVWNETRRQRRLLEQITVRLEEAEVRHEAPSEPLILSRPPCSGFNLTLRVQALRLLRRGEDIAHVAAALNVPRSEVELLIRVQQIRTTRGNRSVTGQPDFSHPLGEPQA